MQISLTAFVLTSFAVYRVTRLIVVDVVTDPVRDPLMKWLRRGGRFRDWFEDLLMCRWCTSVWVAAAATIVLAVYGQWPVIPSILFWLAVAGAQSMPQIAEDASEAAVTNVTTYLPATIETVTADGTDSEEAE